MTTSASYESLALSWQPQTKSDRSFVIIVTITLSLALILALTINSVTVPKEPVRAKVKVPDRVAQFILDKPKPVEPPKPIEKPKPKPPERKQPKITKQQDKKEVVLTEQQKEAREKASESGLLALSEELSDLVDTSDIEEMVGKSARKAGASAINSRVDTSSLAANANRGSGGVSAGDTFAQAGGNVALDDSQVSVAQTLLAARVKEAKDTKQSVVKQEKPERVGNYRPQEEIAFVMDKNKGKLHSLYRRARRSDPSIEGKIILDITIAPDGSVINVVVKSSELNNSKLETRIISRVKQFKFGAANVKTVTVTYPIEFLPS